MIREKTVLTIKLEFDQENNIFYCKKRENKYSVLCRKVIKCHEIVWKHCK